MCYIDKSAHVRQNFKRAQEECIPWIKRQRDPRLIKTEKRIIICTAAVVLIALSIYPTVTYLVPFIKYSHAVSLMEKGSFDEATAAFEEMGDYKDAPEKIGECAELKEQAFGSRLSGCGSFDGK